MEPPKILRIKRKRGQDPLQALILEDSHSAKRSKPSSPIASGTVTPNENFYFQLTRTDEFNQGDLVPILAETSRTTDERNFIIPKPEDDIIPHELSDLINDFMITNDTEETNHRKKRNHSVVPQIIPQEDEYVYDVYQLAPMTNQNHPKSQIGYIKFFDNEVDIGSDQSDVPIYSDNEDSNAEDYYQNDYPEDEDADIGNDIHNDYKTTDLEDDQINDLYDYVQSNDVSLLNNYVSEDDDDYILEDDEDDDDDDEDDDEEFDREKFFDGETDDEMAIHRDKIFSKLKRMIDEPQ